MVNLSILSRVSGKIAIANPYKILNVTGIVLIALYKLTHSALAMTLRVM